MWCGCCSGEFVGECFVIRYGVVWKDEILNDGVSWGVEKTVLLRRC